MFQTVRKFLIKKINTSTARQASAEILYFFREKLESAARLISAFTDPSYAQSEYLPNRSIKKLISGS